MIVKFSREEDIYQVWSEDRKVILFKSKSASDAFQWAIDYCYEKGQKCFIEESMTKKVG